MKTFRVVVLALLLVTVLAGVVSAQGTTPPTITFTVPVRLYSLDPSIVSVAVYCLAYDANNVMVASGTLAGITLTADGNLERTFTIVASQTSGKDITQARSYRVRFELSLGGGVWNVPSQGNSTPALRPKEGTPFVQSVTGAITW
jgi:hypothetical protein